MNWKYWVTRKMNPNRAKNATVTDALAAEKAGVRNSVRSIIGRARRRSTATNPATKRGRGDEAGQAGRAAPAAGRVPR